VKDAQANRRIDVYHRGRFVFEAKQGINPKAQGDAIAKAAAKAKTGHSKSAKGAGVRGSAQWRDAMQAGRTQAGNYAVNVTLRGRPQPVTEPGECRASSEQWTRLAARGRADAYSLRLPRSHGGRVTPGVLYGH
jgi:hypothetical protein